MKRFGPIGNETGNGRGEVQRLLLVHESLEFGQVGPQRFQRLLGLGKVLSINALPLRSQSFDFNALVGQGDIFL